MRKENDLWIWILVSDTWPWEGDAQVGDGLWASPHSSLGPSRSPCADAMCLGITPYETDFLL